MKKINTFLVACLVIFLAACEGPAGPPGFDGFDGQDGRDGRDGLDGVNITGQIIDIEGTFSAENEFAIFFEFPQTIEVFDTDVVLVYLLFEQLDDPQGGDPIDVWRLLPQTRILNQGLLQYNYDHTFLDVNIFLESDFDLNTLPAGDTDNQVFRIAVVPADQLAGGRMDSSNVQAVMGLLGVEESAIQKITLE